MNADIYSLFLTGANVESMSVAALKQLIASAGYTLDGAPAWLECPVLQQLSGSRRRPEASRLRRAALWADAATPSRAHALWEPRVVAVPSRA